MELAVAKYFLKALTARCFWKMSSRTDALSDAFISIIAYTYSTGMTRVVPLLKNFGAELSYNIKSIWFETSPSDDIIIPSVAKMWSGKCLFRRRAIKFSSAVPFCPG